jgi:hypothetical protein
MRMMTIRRREDSVDSREGRERSDKGRRAVGRTLKCKLGPLRMSR